ncbi:uncharacterized protein FTJAE_3484 [Fusarium tjaetaba]|uniref:Uncharacterized protein n=1 Tax=Fusarium tjaetaba TaxID=1567544 RepID=A0A8H5W2C0_9HYPO|nr:uncharacterized protein FTJAE_3484 [Fusarium tjaetaba]KAF5642768.1 hypothetical protein FTJAE_3484 [Fusarium tjaetaba]
MSDRALAEVDGLLAAFIYLDHTEPSSHKSLTYTNNLPNDRTAIPFNNSLGTQSHSINDDIRASDLAWASARAVRDEMQMLWGMFVKVSRGLDVAVINNLRSGYEDAQGLRYAGVFAYRNTLTGLRPTNLARIFALCGLSYVVHRILHAKGRLLQDGFLTDIRIWRDAIEDEDERRAFSQLTSHLWSECQNHRSSKNLNSREPYYFTRSLQHDESTSLPPAKHCVSPFDQQSPAKYTQQAHQHPGPQGTPWSFKFPYESDSSSLLLANCESTNDLGACDHGLESFAGLTTDAQRMYNTEPHTESGIWSDLSSINSVDFSMLDMLAFRTHGSPVAQPLTRSQFDMNPLHEPDDRSLVGITTSANSLQTNSVYIAIREFIHDNGQFWFQLAGRGLVSKDIASCQSWCQERWAQKKHIRTSYIQKLLSARRTQDKTSSGIISIVDTFVDWGFLQSIENIEFYMEGLADLLFDDKTSRQEFSDWIRASSGSGKGQVDEAELIEKSCTNDSRGNTTPQGIAHSSTQMNAMNHRTRDGRQLNRETAETGFSY